MPLTENDLAGVYQGDVLSASGEKIGSVGQVYLDDRTGDPTFVTANTGLFGTSQSFIPLRGARVDSGNVVVDFDKTTVKDAPRIEDDGRLSPAEEDQLYAYYGMGSGDADTDDYGVAGQTPVAGYAEAGVAGTPVPDGGDAGNVTDRDTRDQPVDGDRPAAPSERGRLRKWVRTRSEPVETEEVHTQGSDRPEDATTR